MKPYYDDGRGIVIYHGDCREILPSLPKVDLVLTDPPYGEVNQEDSGLRCLDKGSADEIKGGELEAILSIDSDCFYVWCGTEQVSLLRAGFVARAFSTRLGIWEKTNPSPMNGQFIWLSGLEACVFAKRNGAPFNEFCKSAIWKGPTESVTEHPTEKPIWLFHKLILASSNQSQTILDPFMGSGTTLRAAKDLGRKAIGIEIEERYCEIAARRLQQEVLFT
jgi:site-specific DNA-methyltransferase (adenine-specific)